MIHFAKETLFNIVDEIDGLLEMHYRELTLHKDRIMLDPLWEDYGNLESAERLAVFTARDDDELVGYAAFFIMPHLHYRDTTLAHNDVLYLHPGYRNGAAGVRFIKFCESQIKALGADKITWHVKLSLDWTPILHRLGYNSEEVVVGKML